jgi:hypothetical protein
MCWEGPLKPKRVQRGKPRVLSFRTAGLPKWDPRNRITVALSKTVIRFFFEEMEEKSWEGLWLTRFWHFSIGLEESLEKEKQGLSATFLKGASWLFSEERCIMMKGEDLMFGLVCWGRGMVQDFVARSQDVTDVINYLHAERGMEIAKKISFVTTDNVTFERKEFFRTASERPQDVAQTVA